MEKKALFSARNVAYLAVLLALVVVLQSVALVTGLFLGTSLSLVLIPIVLGGVFMGWKAGTLLGFVFGLLTLLFGVFGWDAFTAMLLNENPFMTAAICLVKGTAAGLVPGLLYSLLARRAPRAAVVVAALVAPVVNTGLFILGAMCMQSVFEGMAGGQNVLYFLVVVISGINFLIEFSTTAIAAPSVWRVTQAVRGRRAAQQQGV